MKFLKSLTFRICILISLIEIIFFVILGAYYSVKYVNQLQESLTSHIALPGQLISQGLLNFESITEPGIIEDIVGIEPLEAYIIGLNMNVFYSLDPEMIGLSVNDIPTLNLKMFSIINPKITIIDLVVDGISSKVCISPVFSFNKVSPTLFTYIRIPTESIEKEQTSIIISFFLGFLICIVLTNLTVILIFNLYIYKRIDESLVVIEKVKHGDLNARLKLSHKSDEISHLQSGINSMIYKLQLQVTDLNNEIAERKRQEEEKENMRLALTQSTKLADLGALSAGIAHEFKNPISGISMTVQNIRMRLLNETLNKNITVATEHHISMRNLTDYVKDRKIDEMVSTIEDITHNMNEIIGNMLSYSRKTEVEYSLYNIKDILEESLVLARFNPSFRSIFEINLDLEENLPDFECHKNEIIQVFLNILSNGSEAMLNYKINTDYRSTFNIHISSSDNFLVIKINDNGPGMNQESKETLFEPFYTTKDIGKGTGLGLYICRMIVEEKHNGELSIESEIDRGSTFHIILPTMQKRRLNL